MKKGKYINILKHSGAIMVTLLTFLTDISVYYADFSSS